MPKAVRKRRAWPDDLKRYCQLNDNFALCWLKLNVIELQYSNVMKAIDYFDVGNVLGEAIDCCSKTLHSRLRNAGSRSETFTQCASFAVQHSRKWRAASEPHEVGKSNLTP
jgi:hypothetical protein